MIRKVFYDDMILLGFYILVRVFGFLIEDNDTFHFLSIQSSLSVKKAYDFLFNLKYFLNYCNKF